MRYGVVWVAIGAFLACSGKSGSDAVGDVGEPNASAGASIAAGANGGSVAGATQGDSDTLGGASGSAGAAAAGNAAGASGGSVAAGASNGGSAPQGGSGAGGAGGGANRKVTGPCTVQTDKNADGTIEQSFTYAYDAEGHVVRTELAKPGAATFVIAVVIDPVKRTWTINNDYENDGHVDAVTVNTFDDSGHLVLETYDNNNDGTIDWNRKSTYDSAGNLIDSLDAYTGSAAGHHMTCTYDAQGHMLTSSQDDDSDGVIEFYSVYTYDEQGHLIERDINNGQTVMTWTFDSAGHQLTESQKSSGDEYAIKSSYDADGNLVRKEVIRGPSQTLTSIETMSYDADGNLLRTELDRNADGTADTITTTSYDEYGNRLTVTTDDKEPAAHSTTTYGYACWT